MMFVLVVCDFVFAVFVAAVVVFALTKAEIVAVAVSLISCAVVFVVGVSETLTDAVLLAVDINVVLLALVVGDCMFVVFDVAAIVSLSREVMVVLADSFIFSVVVRKSVVSETCVAVEFVTAGEIVVVVVLVADDWAFVVFDSTVVLSLSGTVILLLVLSLFPDVVLFEIVVSRIATGVVLAVA